jgi:hypothetical protein
VSIMSDVFIFMGFCTVKYFMTDSGQVDSGVDSGM